MSTVLEVGGLAALVVGVFLLLGTPYGLVVLGVALFLYAQTVDDDDLITIARRHWPKSKPGKHAAPPAPPAQPPAMTRSLPQIPAPTPGGPDPLPAQAA